MKGQFGEIKRQMMRWMSGWKVHAVWIFLRLADRDVLKQKSPGTGLGSSFNLWKFNQRQGLVFHSAQSPGSTGCQVLFFGAIQILALP